METRSTQNNPSGKKSLKERLSQATRKQWIKFILITIFCIAFTIWTGYYAVLLLIILFFDSYILKFIPWSFWRTSKNRSLRKVMEWVDAIGFALIAVYVINTFFFQNYQIPSSSFISIVSPGSPIALFT